MFQIEQTRSDIRLFFHNVKITHWLLEEGMDDLLTWRANSYGNTFLILYTDKNSGHVEELLQQIKSNGLWTFDSALLLNDGCGASVSMAIHERDGTISTMCGNGLRAVAEILDGLGKPRTIAAGGNIYHIERTANKNYFVPIEIEHKGTVKILCTSVNAPLFENIFVGGEPHAVVCVPNIDQTPLEQWGKFITPDANCTIFSVGNNGYIRARTFERGVNRETDSCGTGAAAAAFAASAHGLLVNRVYMKDHELLLHVERHHIVLEGRSSIRLTKPQQGEIDNGLSPTTSRI